MKRFTPRTKLHFILFAFGVALPVVLTIASWRARDTWQGDALLGAASTLAASYLSVTIIDWILGRQLDARWKPVSKFAEQRMNGIANLVITAAMSTYGVIDSTEIPDEYSNEVVLKITEERLAFAANQLLAEIDRTTLSVSPESWRYYYRELGDIGEKIDRLLMVMGDRMEPVAHRMLLRLSQHLAPLRMWLEIFQTSLGVPHDSRPPNSKYSPAELDQLMNYLVSNQVKTTVEYAVRILRQNIAAGIVPRVLVD